MASLLETLDGVFAKTKQGKVRCPLLHSDNGSIKEIAAGLAEQGVNFKNGRTPHITAVSGWIEKNIHKGIVNGFLRGKLVRSDLEIIEDKEANWIEYCILFYSIARNLGIECSFGLYKQSVDWQADGMEIAYQIFAREGEATVAISPRAMFSGENLRKMLKEGVRDINDLEDTPDEVVAAPDFFRRVFLLSKSEIFQVMRTKWLLYYAGSRLVWLHRPEPNVLSAIITEGKNRVWDIRRIFEKQPSKKIVVNFSFIDFTDKSVLTSSQEERRKFSRDFKVSFAAAEAVCKEAKGEIERELSQVIFNENMEKISKAFEADVKKHYNPMYA